MNRGIGFILIFIGIWTDLLSQSSNDTLLVFTDRDCCPSLNSSIRLSPLVKARNYNGKRTTKDLKKVDPNIKVVIFTNPETYKKRKFNISGLNQLSTVVFASNGLSGKKEIELSKSIMNRDALQIVLLDGLVINEEQLRILKGKPGFKIESIN